MVRYARLVPLAGAALSLVCIGLALPGCSGTVRDVLVSTGIGAEPKPAPDFITSSRPETYDYKPTGVAPPPRAMTAKTADEIKKAESDLDKARIANEARGAKARSAGGTPAAAPANPAATAAKKPATEPEQ